jgi:hypothetical protein
LDPLAKHRYRAVGRWRAGRDVHARTRGVFDTRGEFPNYAIFYVTVEDVPATLARAEAWAPSA